MLSHGERERGEREGERGREAVIPLTGGKGEVGFSVISRRPGCEHESEKKRKRLERIETDITRTGGIF